MARTHKTHRPPARRLLLAALLLLLSLPGHTQTSHAAKSYKVILDPAQTEIHWKLSAGLRTVHGTFKLKTGQVIFSPATGVAEGEILIDATTGESGNAARDKHMQDEVLESNRYPAIFFHPTTLKGTFKPEEATQQLSADGTFNIHGADHPLTLPLKVQVAAGAATVTTQFTVPYVDWGMKDPSHLILRVGKQVEIEVTAKGTLSPAD